MADTASANSSKNTSADVNSATEGCDTMPGGNQEGRVSKQKRQWDDMECFSASQAKRSCQDGFQVSDNWAPRGGKTILGFGDVSSGNFLEDEELDRG